MTDDLIERMKEALEGVTDGPWYVQHKAGTDHLFMGNTSQMANETYYPWVPENLRDWEFFAAARTLLPEAIEEIKRLEAKLAKVVEAGVDVAASLNAAISLLERGGKKAAPSDKMFAQILVDYSASLDRFRTTLAELTGGKDE